MDKLEKALEIANEFKLNELLNKKKQEEEEKAKCNAVLWVVGIVVALAAIAAVGYALYRYFNPDYLEDFEEDFEDDFEEDEDDFFEDEGEH